MRHDAGFEGVVQVAVGELPGGHLHVIVHLERRAVGRYHLGQGLNKVNEVDEAVFSDSVPVVDYIRRAVCPPVPGNEYVDVYIALPAYSSKLGQK